MDGMIEYVRLLIYFVVVVGMGGSLIILSHFVGPWRDSRDKWKAYECGVPAAEPDSRRRFNIQFYMIATFFILFDIETIFIIPWAVEYRNMGDSMIIGLADMGVFMLILAVGLIYILRSRVLKLGMRLPGDASPVKPHINPIHLRFPS